MDLERSPHDFYVMLTGEAVDTRLADVAERSYEIGVQRHAWRHGCSLSLYSRPTMPGFTFDPGLLVSIPAFLVAITVHEFSHGLVATLFGDDLPRRVGRLTLNPPFHPAHAPVRCISPDDARERRRR